MTVKLETPLATIDALHALADTRGRRPLKVQRDVVDALLRDHHRMAAALKAHGVAIAGETDVADRRVQ